MAKIKNTDDVPLKINLVVGKVYKFIIPKETKTYTNPRLSGKTKTKLLKKKKT